MSLERCEDTYPGKILAKHNFLFAKYSSTDQILYDSPMQIAVLKVVER